MWHVFALFISVVITVEPPEISNHVDLIGNIIMRDPVSNVSYTLKIVVDRLHLILLVSVVNTKRLFILLV